MSNTKTIMGFGIILALVVSVLLFALSSAPARVSGTSSVYGDYAYKGGYFAIDMYEPVATGTMAHIYGTFEYWPTQNMINGNVTIVLFGENGQPIKTLNGTLEYTNNALQIVGEDGKVYYYYPAKDAREAFWKGFIAVYEYEMHRGVKEWRDITLTPNQPNAHPVIGQQAEIFPVDKFEIQNLGALGLYGPYKYYIIRVKEPGTGIVVSIKLIVVSGNNTIFVQEIAAIPAPRNAQTNTTTETTTSS